LLFTFTTNLAFGQLVANPNFNNNTLIECDTEADDEYWGYIERTRELRESIDLTNMRQIHTIYIAAHVVVDDENNPTNEFGVDQVDESIELLNQSFSSVGFSFERCLDVNFISELEYPQPEYEDIYPNFPYGSQTMADIMENESEVGHLNAYFVDTRENYDGTLVTSGGIAPIPDGSLDNEGNLDIDYVLFSTNRGPSYNTLAHEVGHHFNLLHTYEGHHDPLKRENVARSGTDANCGLLGIGDELCDTPADPTFRFLFTNNNGFNILYQTSRCSTSSDEMPSCELYQEEDLEASIYCNLTDENDELYLPPINNFMGGGHADCSKLFTNGQIARMRTSILVDRSHLLSSDCEDCIAFKTFPASHLHDENTLEIHSVSAQKILLPGQL